MPAPSLRYVAPLFALACLLGADQACAQSAFPAGKVPPPPSAGDPLPKSTTEKARSTKKARPKKAERSGEPGELSASSSDVAPSPRTRSGRGSAGGEGYSERIDTRSAPSSRSFDLEDDPRAVRPILQGGRPGVGMRF